MTRPSFIVAMSIALLLVVNACQQPRPENGQAPPQETRVPTFEVDPFWPNMPEQFVVGRVAGIAVDGEDHVWVVHREATITEDLKGAVPDPPLAECCIPAPAVMEFDSEGNYVQGWGGPGEGYEWPGPTAIHGIHVDHRNNIWISSAGAGPDSREEHQLLKFDRNGKFLLQIGRRGRSTGSQDTNNVNQASDMWVHPDTNEFFVADGYGNRRVIVFDADTGVYKRHWGAYGNEPDDAAPRPALGTGGAGDQFNLVHGIRVSGDGRVYVADRLNNRVQVFSLDGEFADEVFIARETAIWGTAFAIAFSSDPQQQFMYVADGGNRRVRILDRGTLEVLGSFGRWGRYAGQLGLPHNLAVDLNGNVYVAEIRDGRFQKFVLDRSVAQ